MNKTKTRSAIAQFRKMTETPVGKLIIALGIPTTISMLITNIYNMADTFLVIGVICIMIDILFFEAKREKKVKEVKISE